MATELHHQSTGIVWVRDLARNVHYHGTLAEFQAAYGQPMPSLPAGITERLYQPGRRHALSGPTPPSGALNLKDGGPVPWAFGDAVIADIDHLISTMPPIPPPGG